MNLSPLATRVSPSAQSFMSNLLKILPCSSFVIVSKYFLSNLTIFQFLIQKKHYTKIIHLKPLRTCVIDTLNKPTSLLAMSMSSTYNTRKNRFTLTKLVIYIIFHYIHLKTKWDNYFMKFVIPLMRDLLRPLIYFFKFAHHM